VKRQIFPRAKSVLADDIYISYKNYEFALLQNIMTVILLFLGFSVSVSETVESLTLSVKH
jgi:hypothetical protein